MKLGVMNPAVASMPFKEAMEYLASLKIDCVELGAGGYPGRIRYEFSEAPVYLAPRNTVRKI